MATLRAKTFTAKVEHLGPVIPGSIQMAVDWVNEAWTSKLVGSDVEKCRIANGTSSPSTRCMSTGTG